MFDCQLRNQYQHMNCKNVIEQKQAINQYTFSQLQQQIQYKQVHTFIQIIDFYIFLSFFEKD